MVNLEHVNCYIKCLQLGRDGKKLMSRNTKEAKKSRTRRRNGFQLNVFITESSFSSSKHCSPSTPPRLVMVPSFLTPLVYAFGTFFLWALHPIRSSLPPSSDYNGSYLSLFKVSLLCSHDYPLFINWFRLLQPLFMNSILT